MINIAEKLKDTPIGTKLYSPIYDEVNLDYIERDGTIRVRISSNHDRTTAFNMWGQYYRNIGECLLFPSKEQRDWNNYTFKKKYVFKPFDKVIVRDSNNAKWQIDLFGYMGDDSGFCNFYCLSTSWKQCLPYNEETAKLIGTTNNYYE